MPFHRSSVIFLASIFGLFCLGTFSCGQEKTPSDVDQPITGTNADAESAALIKSLSESLEMDPDNWKMRQFRAETLFRAGKIKESVSDFDKVVELQPALKAANWQRGIALYYVGRFADGVEQFEEHHRVNPDDVENTFWYFLCLAKADSIEAARKKIIPSRGDARAPLMEVYKLVRGEMEPADVEKAIQKFQSGSFQRANAEFYGYLYLGLWFDLLGDKPKAIDYLKKSIASETEGYMMDVAKIHLQSLEPKETK